MAITQQTAARAPRFSYPQLLCVLRHMRIRRDETHRAMLALEERVASGWDGEHETARRWLQVEVELLDSAIRCMWVEVLKPL